MKKNKFLRRNWNKYKRIGGKKKKQVWRRPRGRHNKIREKRRGYPARVSIGRKKSEVKKINVIRNLKELEKMKGNKVILAGVGKKNKQKIIEKAKELGIEILNLEEKK